MKAFVYACVALVVIGVVAGVALDVIQKPADKAFTTSNVRLDR